MLTKTLQKYITCLCLTLTLFVLFSFNTQVNAFFVEDVDVPITNNFVLTPSKVEVSVSPGGAIVKSITVANRTNKTTSFNVVVEDFIGTHKQDDAVVLLGDETSPYTLKDFIVPEIDTFTLLSGQQITLPVTVALPSDAVSGGRYAAVIVSNTGDSVDSDTQEVSTTRIVSRLASLFFVSIDGERDESGVLKDFRISGPRQTIREDGEVEFEILFENDGDTHLVPYGFIEIRNMFGSVVAFLPLDPYFALPNATRFRKIAWNGGHLFGKYRATLMLNRGYDDVIDEQSILLFVYPLKTTAKVLFVLLMLFVSARFIHRKWKVKNRG